MPDITIADRKRALVEVREICLMRTFCTGCPFDNARKSFCPIQSRPDEWEVDCWKENAHAQTD